MPGDGQWLRRRVEDDGLQRRIARLLNTSSALLSLSVLLDSLVEHYRGMFFNRAMLLPIVTSGLSLLSSTHGARDTTIEARHLRNGVSAFAVGVGFIGSGFHLYNVGKRESGPTWHNLFYGAPLGAPLALILAGLMGTVAERVRDSHPGRLRVFGLPADRMLAALTTCGLLGTIAESALLHFRGAFQNKFMATPVTIPPVAALLIAKAGIEGRPRWPRLTRLWLWLTMASGIAGTGFHAYGVSRHMGGWRNWSQNVIDGPPIPAPPGFTALALAGLAVLDLLMERRHG
jgi:hypothetical protein